MRWVLIDVALALAALVLLAFVLLSLWRRTKALMREVAKASEAVAAAGGGLALQSEQERAAALPPGDTQRSPAGHREQAPPRRSGVR